MNDRMRSGRNAAPPERSRKHCKYAGYNTSKFENVIKLSIIACRRYDVSDVETHRRQATPKPSTYSSPLCPYPPTRVAQALAVSDSPTGPFRIGEDLVFDRYSEDVSVWSDPGRGLIYGILHDTKGFAVIASKDGIDWRDARNFRAIGKKIPKAGGGFLTPTRFERPAIFFEDGAPRVLSGAAQFNGGKDACILLLPLDR